MVLIPNYPVVNVLLTSFIFTCAAHEICEVTGALAPYFVPQDRKLMLRYGVLPINFAIFFIFFFIFFCRNLVVFLLCLLPIGISDGMI